MRSPWKDEGRETEIGTRFRERHELISQTFSLDAYYVSELHSGSKYTPEKCLLTVNVVYFLPYYDKQLLKSMMVATLQFGIFSILRNLARKPYTGSHLKATFRHTTALRQYNTRDCIGHTV